MYCFTVLEVRTLGVAYTTGPSLGHFLRLLSRRPPELQSYEGLSRERRPLPGGCPHHQRLLERDLSYLACTSVHRGMTQLAARVVSRRLRSGGRRTPVRTLPQHPRSSFVQASVGHTGGQRPHRVRHSSPPQGFHGS